MKPTIAVTLASIVLMLPACSYGPTSASQSPDVAGTYSGPAQFSVDDTLIQTVTMRIDVSQRDSQLTVTSTMPDDDGPFPETFTWTGNIDATGLFAIPLASASVPECGTYRTTEHSITFSGNTARYVERGTTDNCGTGSIVGTLTR